MMICWILLMQYILYHILQNIIQQIKQALNKGKHVLCESPFALNENECEELIKLANENDLILMDSLKLLIQQHIIDYYF